MIMAIVLLIWWLVGTFGGIWWHVQESGKISLAGIIGFMGIGWVAAPLMYLAMAPWMNRPIIRRRKP